MINNLKIIDKSIFSRGVSSYTTTKDLIEILIKKRDTAKVGMSHTIYKSGVEVLCYGSGDVLEVLVLTNSSTVKGVLELVASFEFISLIDDNKTHNVTINNNPKNIIYFYPVVIFEKDVSLLFRYQKDTTPFNYTISNDTLVEETIHYPNPIEKEE